MKELIFDARHIKKGGIGIYIQNILNLIINCDLNLTIILEKGVCYDEYEFLHQSEKFDVLYAPKIFSIMEQFWFFRKRAKIKNRFYFSPYLTFPLFIKIKLIYVIHDLIWLKYPNYATSKLALVYFKFFINKGINKAFKIITISNNTKLDIINYAEKELNNITTFYNGVNLNEFQNIENRNKGFDYFIYVGIWKKWKRVPFLLEAFSHLLHKLDKKNIRLVLCGDNSANKSDDVIGILKKNKMLNDNVIITHRINRDELLTWVKGAIALVQPSEYEGFGLPIIESLALNVPVICSDIEVFKEIGVNYVHYFNKNDVCSLSNKMIELLDKKNNGIDIKPNPSKEFFEKFKWENVANFIKQILDDENE